MYFHITAFSRLALTALLLLVLAAAGAGLLGFLPVPPASSGGYDLGMRDGGWSVHIGDLPVQAGRAPDESAADWKPWNEDVPQYEGKRYTGYLWLKRPLPAGDWKHPVLYVRDLAAYEVYLGAQPLDSSFSLLELQASGPSLRQTSSGSGSPGSGTLLVRSYQDAKGIQLGHLSIGSERDVWLGLFRRDLNHLAPGTLFLGAAVTGCLLYLRRRTKPAYLYFALLAGSAAFGTLLTTEMAALFLPDRLQELALLALPAGGCALFALLDSFCGSGPLRLRRWMSRSMLGLLAISLAASLWDRVLYKDTITLVFPLLFLVCLLLSAWLTVQSYRSSRERSDAWLLAGYGVGALALVLSVLARLLPGTWRDAGVPSLGDAADGIFLTVLLFLVCLGMMLLQRSSEAYIRAERFLEEFQRQNHMLAAAGRLNEERLAIASRELQAPLNGIIGLAESLLDGAAGPLNRTARSSLELAVSSGKRLSCLTRDLIDFSLAKHPQPLRRTEVEVGRSIRLALDVFTPLAAKKGVALTASLPAGLPAASAEESRLEQILYALLGQALAFTSAGEIGVKAGSRDGFIEVTVFGTGVGLQKEARERIQLAFGTDTVPAERASHEGEPALSLTRTLVEGYGGTLEDRQGPDRILFRFTLPMWERTPGVVSSPIDGERLVRTAGIHADPSLEASVFSAAQGRQEVSAGRHSGAPGLPADSRSHHAFRPAARILIVDEDPVNLQVLGNLLALQPYTIVQAASGPEALASITAEKPDLLLIDLMMPRMTGYDIIRHIRRLYKATELPILLVTDKDRVDGLVEGFEAGANDCVTKPVVKKELIARIEQQLQLYRMHRSLEMQMEERTLAHEETKRRLQESMRETAEAVAELSVAEERGRAAREIHDIVGHTLTTTVVQIEAAKRLIAKNDEKGFQKLDVSQELVRKSLNEIRHSVHMLSASTADYDLAAALRQLLHDTQDTSGIEVEHRISPMPPLSALQKKVIYHALQEGLANGMRHGDSRRFRFRLTQEERELHFLLTNDGRPYTGAPMGYGLTAMKERVQQLGGSMNLSAGDLDGCRLDIVLPVD
ncbi:response regulator [Paenibacillus mucilaginosus]|uniref:histidine kinase n=1 Tax=Paenibacillus mucilaginosus (strain KNP414) TaxID=1036673 RepID=F8FNF0_PAEMK|nr:response regulator [Paenibacillus mucilaginosus]AEI38987.1 YxjM [Paenibacillus mucilaginosus KNP414]MCG7216604.1 response regulator [Paenibacillus mucilaginosus]WDM28028.1 response regulator [Paenibacillus mucilaginosus]